MVLCLHFFTLLFHISKVRPHVVLGWILLNIIPYICLKLHQNITPHVSLELKKVPVHKRSGRHVREVDQSLSGEKQAPFHISGKAMTEYPPDLSRILFCYRDTQWNQKWQKSRWNNLVSLLHVSLKTMSQPPNMDLTQSPGWFSIGTVWKSLIHNLVKKKTKMPVWSPGKCRQNPSYSLITSSSRSILNLQKQWSSPAQQLLPAMLCPAAHVPE